MCTSNRMTTEINSSKTSDLPNGHRDNGDSEIEARILTRQEVCRQIKNYIAPVTKKLEDLSRLIKGLSSVHQTNPSPTASTSVYSSAAD